MDHLRTYIDLMNRFFGSDAFMPHGHCYLWQPDLLWLHVVSDLLIVMSYYSIPVALVYFVCTRRDLAFRWMFVLFGIFILACGTTHLMSVWTIWTPAYWLEGYIKAVTAASSVITAVLLWPLIPKALAMPSPDQLRKVNSQLEMQAAELKRSNDALRTEIIERERAEEQIKVLAKFPSENPNPVLRIAQDGTVLYGNDASAPLLNEWGCEVGQPVPEELKQTVKDIYGSQKSKIHEIKNKDRIFSMVFAPVAESGYINIYAIDVTEQRQAVLEIKKLSAAIEQSSNVVFITDINGVIEYVNPVFEVVTGYAREEALGQTPRILSSGETPDSLYGEMWGTIKGGWTWRGVLKNKTKFGGRYWCNTVISPVKDRNGKIINFLAVQEDITEKRASEEKIKYLAFHDEMTDLLNRSSFMELLGERLLYNLEDREPGALLMLDIDHFKFINDSYGHGMGDEILRNVSRLLKKVLQDKESILGRLGGDEFAIYLPSMDESKGMEMAEKVREQIEEFRPGNHPFRLSVSIGAAVYPVHGATVSELFTKVDAAMYRAKELGRNRCHLYRNEDHILEDIHSRLKWKERILKALEDDRFEVWAQPIMGLNDNKIRHYEALARMRDEEGNILLPGAFIEVAERFNIIGAIDRQIIKKTLKLMSEASSKGKSLTFSINLSGKDLMDEELLLFIQSAIAETGADPDHIVFEITETAAVFDIERAVKFIKALKSIGCHLSLDDFGVGFTSFTYLRELDVDYIKIDGSFIRNLKKNRNDQLFVKAIADVARGMGIKSIAEFVESEESFKIAKKLGVDYAQGYHIGKPEHLVF
ncbi:MAG: EAL domain-containing protein [Deltaproteobacteria bacterium]|nr:EAL domain-containing protein [Deltaproteobacteria bacterium]